MTNPNDKTVVSTPYETNNISLLIHRLSENRPQGQMMFGNLNFFQKAMFIYLFYLFEQQQNNASLFSWLTLLRKLTSINEQATALKYSVHKVPEL